MTYSTISSTLDSRQEAFSIDMSDADGPMSTTGFLINYSPVEPWLMAGSDAHFVGAARASTARYFHQQVIRTHGPRNETIPLTEKDLSLLDDLIKLRHSGPFMHGIAAFYIMTTAAQWAHIAQHPELKRSRESARYKTVQPHFYGPSWQMATKRIEGSTSMRPELELMTELEYQAECNNLIASAQEGWARYMQAKRQGVPNERARYHLPTHHMTAGVVSGRPLDWLRAISVRVSEGNERETYPQPETEAIFSAVLGYLRDQYPETMDAFIKYGMIAP